jgi:hypothetical protein
VKGSTFELSGNELSRRAITRHSVANRNQSVGSIETQQYDGNVVKTVQMSLTIATTHAPVRE